jgi:hypothetical protein
MNDQIIFTDVQPIDIHFRILYSSLSQRLFKISHESTPSFDEHIKFVSNHPYRIWVIIEMNQKLLGNCYIHSDNSRAFRVLARDSSDDMQDVETITPNTFSKE